MTRINDIYTYLCELAPLETAMDFDNCGLLAGSADVSLSRALITLDITCEVIEAAEKLGAELIISHHPVIFNPLKRLETDSAPYMLANRNISAICMHTNLDRAQVCGVNICLANAVGLCGIELDSENCIAYGRVEPCSCKEFAERVKSSLGCLGVRYTDADREIRRAAVSSGAGGSGISLANGRVDAFVTGEIKHHELLFAAQNNICVVDAGHRKTEEVVLAPLKNILSKRFPEVEFTVYRGTNDNIRYL